MRRISQQARFREDVRRQKKRGKDVEEIIAVIEVIAE